MSFRHTLDGLIDKGKQKYQEYSGSSRPQGAGSQHQQQYQYPNQPPPPNAYNHPPSNQPYPPPQQYNQQYNYPPPQNPTYSPPPAQTQQYPPPYAPPIPQHSKPHTQAPPIPTHPSTQSIPQQPHTDIYWQPSFSPSTPVSQNFRHELGAHGWGNNEAQNYTDTPANSFHAPDNRLVVRAIANNGTHTSARLTSHQTLSRPRGYLEVRLRAPCVSGVWPAFWMLPKDPFEWPKDGEVDIFESWGGDCVNHSCLHWGHFNGEDHDKHRVVETHIQSMPWEPHTFGFAWQEEQAGNGWRGKMVWYIDGRPVMKAGIPVGTRRLEEYRILINVAMGGNVCQGRLPANGTYDLVVEELKMMGMPHGGWEGFEREWGWVPEGKAM